MAVIVRKVHGPALRAKEHRVGQHLRRSATRRVQHHLDSVRVCGKEPGDLLGMHQAELAQDGQGGGEVLVGGLLVHAICRRNAT